MSDLLDELRRLVEPIQCRPGCFGPLPTGDCQCGATRDRERRADEREDLSSRLPAIIARLESDAGEIARLRAERDGWQRQTEGLKRLIGHWSRLSPDAERVRDAYEVDPATLLSRHLNALAAALKESK